MGVFTSIPVDPFAGKYALITRDMKSEVSVIVSTVAVPLVSVRIVPTVEPPESSSLLLILIQVSVKRA